MKVIGLTGGIGMGKSTAAAAFRRARIPVFDADLAVHRMQGPGGRAVRAIAALFPDAVAGSGAARHVDRTRLREQVLGRPDQLRRLEQVLHPMVRQEEYEFIARSRRARAPAAVLDIPLLFETKAEELMDMVIVVSAPRAVQMHRVRQRRRMSDADIAAVIDRQMSDREKRRRADIVIRTGLSRYHTQRALRRLILGLRR
ncbi:MAG TPA: dephospho-CoA kinase [Acetobacteraceae bacterium]|nr:dephospho-CoA kinase [Acetobacteraceae bacterium]